ncbi:MAG: hydroxymethylglutaryl-CoA lyase [Rhodospirillaceae bacterium]|nr:hydroxymethylglutaryl-CoA lyase [Rhodospirillaceae bacterium]
MTLPKHVRIAEAGARDGLQNEKQVVPTAVKVELIERLAEAGLPDIEAGSFVSPKWVPQMADSDAVLQQLKRKPGIVYGALVPNMQGYARAQAARVEEIGIFTAASESFTKANINCTIAESIERFRPVVEAAKRDGVRVRAAISCTLGCPFEGEIAPAAVADVARRLFDLGADDIVVADTIGVGTPLEAKRMLEATAEAVPLKKIGIHFHDTYGQALANTLACLELGVTMMDSAVAGLGGCPFAPGATGNVATEDVVYMLHGMGIETGIDLDKLIDAAFFISDHLGRPPVSRVANAMRKRRKPASAKAG